MADKPNTTTEPADSGNHRNYNERRWLKPSKRAQGYAEERKLKVHKSGNKKGEELTEYDKGIRSGYLLCQSDHAGMYKYKKALDEGKTPQEAREISKQKGKKGAA